MNSMLIQTACASHSEDGLDTVIAASCLRGVGECYTFPMELFFVVDRSRNESMLSLQEQVEN